MADSNKREVEKGSAGPQKNVGPQRDKRYNNLRRMLKQMMKDLDELQREEKQN